MYFTLIHRNFFFYLLGDAKNAFNNLKKRYSKKRNDVKRAKRSGAGLADVQKFEKSFEVYSFLGWLNHFLQLRDDTLTNLTSEDVEVETGDDEEEDRDEDEAEYDKEDNETTTEATPSGIKTKKRKSFAKTDKLPFKKKRNEPVSQEENAAKDILQTINQRLQHKSERPQQRDEDDVFGEMVTSEIKKFRKLLKFRFKHEVNNLIFKYQMLCLQDPGTDLLQQQSRMYNFPTTPLLSPIQPNQPCPIQNTRDVSSPSPASSNQSTYLQNTSGKSFRGAADIGSPDSYDASVSNNLWS
jgi:hypothetical protein